MRDINRTPFYDINKAMRAIRDPFENFRKAMESINRDPFEEMNKAIRAITRDPLENFRKVMETLNRDPFENFRESMKTLNLDPFKKLRESMKLVQPSISVTNLLRSVSSVKWPLLYEDYVDLSISDDGTISIGSDSITYIELESIIQN